MTALVRFETPWDLTAERLEGLVKSIAEQLQGRVQATFLFGSCVTGKFRKDSDIDILIISESDRPFTSRALVFADLMDIHPTMDILVYTPAEFDRMSHDPENRFWRRVQSEMKQII